MDCCRVKPLSAISAAFWTAKAGFLSGGITFCSMVPMRSLPFKMVCLLGLNDGDFPRNTKAAVFDLIAKYPKKKATAPAATTTVISSWKP